MTLFSKHTKNDREGISPPLLPTYTHLHKAQRSEARIDVNFENGPNQPEGFNPDVHMHALFTDQHSVCHGWEY